MRTSSLSLRVRLIVFLVVVIVVTTGGLTYLTTRETQQVLALQRRQKNLAYATSIESRLRDVLAEVDRIEDAPGMNSALQNLRLNDAGIRFAAVARRSGEVIFHSERDQIGQRISMFSELTPQEDEYQVYPEPVGAVYVTTKVFLPPGAGYDQVLYIIVATLAEDFNRPLRELVVHNLTFSGGAIVVSVLLLLFLLTRTIHRPLSLLRNGAAAISGGDLLHTINIRGNDEMAFLARAFNDMTARLYEVVSGLERQVQARTRELEQRTAYLQAAADVAREAAAVRDVEDLLERVVQLVSGRFGFYHAGIFLIDESQRYAVLRAASSPGGRRMLERGHRLEVGQTGIVGYVAGTGQARIALDVGADAVHFVNPDLRETRSELGLPLRVRGRVIGVLDVQSTEPNAFSSDDAETLQTLADQLAVAVENARLLAQSEAALRELHETYGQQSISTWYERVKRQALTGFAYDGFTFQSLGHDESAAPANGPQALTVPVWLHGQLLGSIELERSREWQPAEKALLQAISDQLGLALENARLLEETRRRVERERTLNEMTGHLTRSLDMETMLKAAVRELGRVLQIDEVSVHVGALDPAASAAAADERSRTEKD